MPRPPRPSPELQSYRNSRLYRSLTRTLREYNRRMVDGLRQRGFHDFAPAFPTLLSNLDLGGTPIGVLARRAGVSRQAAGQLLRSIEDCGYVIRQSSPLDARITMVAFTARGRRLMANVFELVNEIEAEFAATLPVEQFEYVRRGLQAIADAIDPDGAFGTLDRGGR